MPIKIFVKVKKGISMKTKTAEMLDHLNANQYKEALRIAKSFKIGFTKQEARIVQLGYECLVHPDFYKSLGKDCTTCAETAIKCLNEKYKEKELSN